MHLYYQLMYRELLTRSLFDVMRDSLIEHGTEPEITRWLDYLARNRTVEISEGDVKTTFRPLEGTTQGGHNGPDLWNISIWDIVKLKLRRHCYICKYADDILAIIVGIDLNTVVGLMQQSLNEIYQWLQAKGLKISLSKSFCVIVNQRRKSTPPPLTLGGEEVPYVESFKYLGVIIDKNLTWKDHVTNRVKKAKKDLMASKKLISKSWGLTPNKVKWIYECIVRPSLSYACHVWFKPENPVYITKELNKVQRLALTSITSCFRSTPTVAMERIVNLLPLDLHLCYKACSTVNRIYTTIDKRGWDGIGSRNQRGHLLKWQKYCPEVSPHSPGHRYNLNTLDVDTARGDNYESEALNIYTDGSKNNEYVGAAWVVIYEDTVILSDMARLPAYSTVFESEIYALTAAVELIAHNTEILPNVNRVVFHVDNQSVLHLLLKTRISTRLSVGLINSIETLSANYRGTFSFRWVKSHSGIFGNAEADSLAKRASKSGRIINLGMSMSFIKSKIKEKTNKHMESEVEGVDKL